MTERENLHAHIVRMRRRIRLLLIERYCLFGACAGALAAAILVLLSSRFVALINYELWAGVVLFGAACGFAYALLRRLGNLLVARAIDERAGIKDRMASAVWVESPDESDSMTRALVSDAARHASQLDPKDVFRHQFGRPHAAFGLSMLVLLAAVFAPHLPGLQSQTRRQEVAVMKAEGKKLIKVAKDLKKASVPEEEDLQKLAEKLDKLGKQMATGRMTRKQAMLKTRQLEKQIVKEQDRLAMENAGKKSMAQAQSEMKSAGRQLAREMAEKLAKQQNLPLDEAMKELPSDERMAELARKEGALSESEVKELEKLVAKHADPDSSLPIPQELAEALAKLATNEDYQKAMELMQKLTARLNSGEMSKLDKEALQKQMEQLAKALKDTDLDQLARMMLENAKKLAKMSPEELQKLAEQMEQMQKIAMALQQAGGT